MGALLTTDQLLESLASNRRLTIRTIEAFPDAELFTFVPTEPLRPFSEMVKEILAIERAYVTGIATGKWAYTPPGTMKLKSKAELLAACAEARAETLRLWPNLTVERLLTVEEDGLFGPAMANIARLIYALENEIHHRGQGYVYLRMLGIEPPLFYER
jgi:uncharacterized damage-inducible protein DinB